MRILVLTPGVFDKGGIARYGRFQIRALRESFGEESVKVFSLMGRQNNDLEEHFKVDFAGPIPLTKFSRIYYSTCAFKESNKARPSVVLSQLINFGPLAWIIAKTVHAKLVQNIYGREVWSPITLMRRLALKQTDLVISDCHHSADKALELCLLKNRPHVVWDCVDTEQYCPGEPDNKVLENYGVRKSNRFRVLFLGRITKCSRYKGYERMLRLIAILPEERFEGIIAGDGDDIEHVKNLIFKLGIKNRTFITGPIHERDMPHIYRSADSFYLASEVGIQMGEGIPLTPMEAMACGIPVIVGNQDGSRELLKGCGGWCGDPNALYEQAAYLKRLEEKPDIHIAERGYARARAENAFGYNRFFNETVQSLKKGILNIEF